MIVRPAEPQRPERNVATRTPADKGPPTTLGLDARENVRNQTFGNGEASLQCQLIWCPEVPQGTRVTFLRHEAGKLRHLEAQVFDDPAPSLNLARLRQRGAQLGADTVVLVLP